MSRASAWIKMAAVLAIEAFVLLPTATEAISAEATSTKAVRTVTTADSPVTTTAIPMTDQPHAPLAELPIVEVPLRLPNNLRRDAVNRDADRDSNAESSRSPSSSSNQPEAYQYRLVMQGSSDSLLRQVRRIVPDAFRTMVDGQRMIQVGLFVEREEAEAMQRRLSEINAATRILDLDRPIYGRSSSSGSSGLAAGSLRRQGSYQYRLVVQGSSDSLLRQVRRIVPDAFRTTIDGQRVIQAGLFVDQAEAQVVQQQLSQIDAVTNIFDVSYGVSQRSAARSTRLRDGRILVVVDPGHGGGDPGAVGIGGIHEADIVLDISLQVAALLEKQGVQAILTREDDREIDLEPRVNLAEAVNANLFVSIHANSINMSRPDVNGIETYYYDAGAALAASIHNSLIETTGMADRGIRQARFYVLTHSSMPAVLVEVGFVTGQQDAARLSSPTSRSQIAEGIARGILRYVQ